MDMNLRFRLQFFDEEMGVVYVRNDLTTIVAEIYLDSLGQVDRVALPASAPKEDQLKALKLVASHARQYVMHREVPAMSLASVEIPPEIGEMDRETIVKKELNPLRIGVMTVEYTSIIRAIEAAIDKVGVKGVSYKLISNRFGLDEATVEFSARDLRRFTFWMHHDEPLQKESDLYIIPAYHPVMKGMTLVDLVNGATDACITGNSIKNIHCPRDGQVNEGERDLFGGSWDHVKHPFYVSGRSFTMDAVMTSLRSSKGVEKLAQFLQAALNLDKKYVAVSEGFNAPLQCPSNRLDEFKRQSPRPQFDGMSDVRGSEAHCVWAYRTLQEEGTLEGAYIPQWFTDEGWLKIYENAEVRRGIF